MTTRRLSPLLPLLLPLLSLSFGCHQTPPDPTYAREAYLKQQAAKQEPTSTHYLNELAQPNLTVPIHSNAHAEWKKEAYESYEQWTTRLTETLAYNDVVIRNSEGKLELIEKEQITIAKRIKELTEANETMQKLLVLPPKTNGKEEVYKTLIRPPFTIHLVTKGDTLYSIAMKYYGSSTMVDKILLWNQEWIRSPGQLIAGLGLILFMDNTEEQGQSIVDAYIKQLQQSYTQ